MSNIPNPHHQEEIDLREQLKVYLHRWPIFIISVAACLAGAFLYLRYETPVYNSLATVIIKDQQKGGGMSSELSAFADMGMISGLGTNSIENELGILRSKRLMTNVVKELNLNVRYFQEGTIHTTEIFENRPFNIQLLTFDTESFLTTEEPKSFYFQIISDSTFVIHNEDGTSREKMNFGEAYTLPYAKISVTPNFQDLSEVERSMKKGDIKVTFSTADDVATNYRQRLQVNLTDKNSSLIELSLQDQSPAKARHLIDQLITQYNKEAIADKNLVSLNTANFIEDRLRIITRELDSVETGKEQFKKENKLTNIEAESEQFIENVSEFRNRQLEAETQLELANSMIDYLQSDNGDHLLPSNLGFKEEGVVSIIQSYNQLVLERDRILAGSTNRNPVIVNLNNQIDQIRTNVLQSLKNLRTSLKIALNDLNEQETRIDARIATVPSKEKQFRNIERQQKIKEALYLFLLQKREETSLSLAVTAPKAKIVDAAYSSIIPVSPRPKVIFLAALILGLLIPFLFIYLKHLLNNKIQSRSDIEDLTKEIPILGEIPGLGKKESEVILEHDRSVLGESFRILHTNLQYMLAASLNKPGGNLICVTSSIQGEGKTLVAYNFAMTLAYTGKKVLIVGADLRNPQLQRFEPGARQLQGVSDYLVNNDLEAKDLIKKSKLHSNLDILPSGSIPPNPSELWRTERTADLFKELEKSYDYVILDTAPSLLVTDTFLLNKYADLTLYVTRANYTIKKLINFALDAKKDGKLKNVSFILNDVSAANFGYGNKYGYSYGKQDKGFWNNVKNKVAFW